MPIKLRYKVHIVIMITFVMVAIVFSSILLPYRQQRLEASIEKTEIMLKTLVQQVMNSLANEIFEKRQRAIKLRLEQMQQLKGVLALNVFDSTGRLLVTVGTLKSPSDLSAADQETAETGHFLQRERFRGIKAVRFLEKLSVANERIGFIQIHYSLSDIFREHRESFLIFIFLLASVLIAMLLVLNLLCSHMIISPIIKLRNLIKKIKKDGPGCQMPIQSRDEIGDLASAFNQMSVRLQKLIGRLKHQIEKQKEAEKDLALKNAVLSARQESSPDGILVIDEKGNIILSNHRFQDLWGIPPEIMEPKSDEIALQSVFDKLAFPDEFLERVNYLYEHRNEKSYEEISLADGRTFERYSTPMFGPEGKYYGRVWNFRDITERKCGEEELKKHRDHLEEMVETRTKELKDAQDELIRKERLATLGQLTATVAHEIRNPLGTVQASVFSIGDAINRSDMKRVNRALSLADRNIRRCDGIITELLDFTQQKELKKAPMDIDAWLEGLLNEYRLPEAIEYKPEMNSGTLISFDPEYLRRAVINVITNAVQAMEAEESPGKALNLKTGVVGNRLEIKIIDTGPGIPDDIREKIFDLLFSTKNFGIGLGLTIVEDIMAEHGGGIEIESEVGKGTEVVLWLPVIERPESIVN